MTARTRAFRSAWLGALSLVGLAGILSRWPGFYSTTARVAWVGAALALAASAVAAGALAPSRVRTAFVVSAGCVALLAAIAPIQSVVFEDPFGPPTLPEPFVAVALYALLAGPLILVAGVAYIGLGLVLRRQ